jgi:hypothetical protein
MYCSFLSGKAEEARKKEVLVWSSCEQEVKLQAGQTNNIKNIVLPIDHNIPLTGFLGKLHNNLISGF